MSTPEIGALADLHEWWTEADRGHGAQAMLAAERVLVWIAKGGVPASHWDFAERSKLRILLTAADAGRNIAGLGVRS